MRPRRSAATSGSGARSTPGSAPRAKNQRATLADLRSDMSLPFDRRVKLPIDQLFDVDTLSQFGK